MIDLREFAQQSPGPVRRDMDAVNEGWDPREYPEDSLLLRAYAEFAGIDEDSDEYVDAIDAVIDVLGE